MHQDLMLHALQRSPMSIGLAEVFKRKLGLREDEGEALSGYMVGLIDQIAETEFGGGLHMAAGISSGVQEIGVPILDTTGGRRRNAMISGRNAVAYQASAKVFDQLMGRFYDPMTGTPKGEAFGLDAAEMGRVVADVMRSGGQYAAGPMFEVERHDLRDTQSRIKTVDEEIKQLNTRARGSGRATPERREIDEQLGIKKDELKRLQSILDSGGVEFRPIKESADKFNKMVEDAASLASSVKQILGAEALPDLAGNIDDLLGGTAQEYGLPAARMKMAGIQRIANTEFFGGDTQKAAYFSTGVKDTIAGYLGKRLGLDEATSRAEFGLLGSKMGEYVDRLSVSAAGENQALTGYLGGQGITVRMPGIHEVAQFASLGHAKIAAEEQSALALSHLVQTGALGDEQKTRAVQALQRLSTAGTPDAVAQARNEVSQAVQDLTGKAVGTYLYDIGGADVALGRLAGTGADVFARTVAGTQQARHQALVKTSFRRDLLFGQEWAGGLTKAEDRELLGQVVANLGQGSLNEFESILAEQDPTKREERLKDFISSETTTGKALRQIGFKEGAGGEFERLQGLVRERGTDLSKTKVVARMAGRVREYAGLNDFEGAEQRIRRERQMISDWWISNQEGSTPALDAATQFMMGVLGEEQPRERQLLNLSRENRTKEIANVDRLFQQERGGAPHFVGDEKGARELARIAGPDIFSELKVKEGDMVALAGALEDPEKAAAARKFIEGRLATRSLEMTGEGTEQLFKGGEEDARTLAELAGPEIFDLLGVEPGNFEKLGQAMATEAGTAAIQKYLPGSGMAFGITTDKRGSRLEILGKEQSKRMRRKAEEIGRAELLESMGMSREEATREVARKEGETEEDYVERIKTTQKLQARKMAGLAKKGDKEFEEKILFEAAALPTTKETQGAKADEVVWDFAAAGSKENMQKRRVAAKKIQLIHENATEEQQAEIIAETVRLEKHYMDQAAVAEKQVKRSGTQEEADDARQRQKGYQQKALLMEDLRKSLESSGSTVGKITNAVFNVSGIAKINMKSND